MGNEIGLKCQTSNACRLYLVINKYIGAISQMYTLLSLWEGAATKTVPNIKMPVLLHFGEKDWSNMAERSEEHVLIPNSELIIIKDSGHFMSLDLQEPIGHVKQFVNLNKNTNQ